MTRSPIRAAGEVIESRLAPEPKVTTRALVDIEPMRAGMILGGLAPRPEGERRGITAEDQLEIRHTEAGPKWENEMRQASEALSGGTRLAVNEAGNEAEADLLVESGLLADQGYLVRLGLQAETGIHVNVGVTIDRHPGAE